MFLGMSIYQNEISVAVQERTGKINMVHPEGPCNAASKLKVHVDGKYAYLGTAVELLLAYNPKLSVADTVGLLPEQIQYLDANGKEWNTAQLLALFFKQIKSTLLQDTIRIHNVVVTVAQPLTVLHQQIIRKAAAYAEFRTCTVVDMATIIKEAYHPSVTATKSMLHIQLNESDCHFTLGELQNDKSYVELQRSTVSKIGIDTLIANLQELIRNELNKTTAPEEQIAPIPNENLRALAKQLLQAYVTSDQPYIRILCAFQTPHLELKISRIKVMALIDVFVKEIIGVMQELGTIDIIFYSGAIAIAKPLTQYLNQHLPYTKAYTEYSQTILARGAARMASQLDLHAVPEVSTEIKQQIKEMNINKELIQVLS